MSFFKYEIWTKEADFGDIPAKKLSPWDAILTQTGEVAWWDDSSGWVIDNNQEQFEVVLK